jgi:C-5 cytosine-specific DNA methylase
VPLPLYHCTEFTLHGEDFTHQKKARVFLILTRQQYEFPPLESYRMPKAGTRLGDYLEIDALPPIPEYIYTRLQGSYRDRPRIYDADQTEPVALFTNYGRDRSLFLVRDERAPQGVRPFSLREVANLAGFPSSFQFIGPVGETYDMVVDCVMPSMAQAIGTAVNDYFAAISQLAETPRSLGHREVQSARQREMEMAEALTIDREPEGVDVQNWPSDVQQAGLWSSVEL